MVQATANACKEILNPKPCAKLATCNATVNAAAQRNKKCGQVRMSKTPTHISGAWAAAVKYLGAVICAGQQCSLTYRLAYHKFSHLIMVGVFKVFQLQCKRNAQTTS